MSTTDTVTAKEAAFMLDTDMEQDMRSYRQEVTLQVIKTINRSSELYKDVKFGKQGARKHNVDTIKKTCIDYAKAHNDEFGDLLRTELEEVDWNMVIARV